MISIQKSILLLSFLFFMSPDFTYSQTTIQGRVLSAGGELIPAVKITSTLQGNRDLFGDDSIEMGTEEDGGYSFTLNKPGLYRITFRGVYHRLLTVPVLIYDQQVMEMNVLLLPLYLNNGEYFAEEDYLEWIRVSGNFNNYDYDSAKRFTRNRDGSISAFIPVTSDTVRFQVWKLTYGSGTTPLPPADEYKLRSNNTFESVRYTDLPEDSLEIRYAPGETVSFQRNLPPKKSPHEVVLKGFLAFKNSSDQHWVWPLKWNSVYQQLFKVINWASSAGLSRDKQIVFQERAGINPLSLNPLNNSWVKQKEEILQRYYHEDLHPQQRILLTIAYLGTLQHEKKIQSYMERFVDEYTGESISFDSDILLGIPENIIPIHPAWSHNRSLPGFLLDLTEGNPVFLNYFLQLIQHHPDDQLVMNTAISVMRLMADEFRTAEEVPGYNLIRERYGQGEYTGRLDREFARRQRSGD